MADAGPHPHPHPHPRQVHTTGMDIKQYYTARAALTLGKDMTFRDYAQVEGGGRGRAAVAGLCKGAQGKRHCKRAEGHDVQGLRPGAGGSRGGIVHR